MKSEIFYNAINHRNKIRFLYGMEEIVMDPYFITTDKKGSKVIYGRPVSSKQIRKFEYGRIANIKVLRTFKFSPIIPIISLVN